MSKKKKYSNDNVTRSHWKVLNNRLVLNVDRDGEGGKSFSVIFAFTTSEQARVLAQYLRRSLAEKSYTYKMQYKTSEGFRSTSDFDTTSVTKSDSAFTALSLIRKNEAVARLDVQLFRDSSFGGNCKFQMYFASMLDANIAYEVLKRGLRQTYAIISVFRNNKRYHLWEEVLPHRFGDERVVSAIADLSKEQVDSVLKYISEIKEK